MLHLVKLVHLAVLDVESDFFFLKFWIFEEVKVFDTFASDTELNPDNLDASLGNLDQLKVEMVTY